MKFAHTITISVFSKPGEDDKALLAALKSLAPQNLEQEKLQIKTTKAEGFDKIISIHELTLEKERHTTKFIESLKKKLSKDDLVQLASQENRVDDECFFYLRLDKKKLMEGECALTDSGECFHVKMSIAAFPKKREAAIAVVKKCFANPS